MSKVPRKERALSIARRAALQILAAVACAATKGASVFLCLFLWVAVQAAYSCVYLSAFGIPTQTRIVSQAAFAIGTALIVAIHTYYITTLRPRQKTQRPDADPSVLQFSSDKPLTNAK